MISPEEVEGQLREQVAMWGCIPTFEEIRDVEYVRQSGRTNMFDYNVVMRIMFDSGLYAGVRWLDKCHAECIPWFKLYDQVIHVFERDHGPKEEWFNEGYYAKVELNELEKMEQDRLIELEKIRARRKQLEKKACKVKNTG